MARLYHHTTIPNEENLVILSLLHWLDVFCQLQERPRAPQH